MSMEEEEEEEMGIMGGLMKMFGFGSGMGNRGMASGMDMDDMEDIVDDMLNVGRNVKQRGAVAKMNMANMDDMEDDIVDDEPPMVDDMDDMVDDMLNVGRNVKQRGAVAKMNLGTNTGRGSATGSAMGPMRDMMGRGSGFGSAPMTRSSSRSRPSSSRPVRLPTPPGMIRVGFNQFRPRPSRSTPSRRPRRTRPSRRDRPCVDDATLMRSSQCQGGAFSRLSLECQICTHGVDNICTRRSSRGIPSVRRYCAAEEEEQEQN